MYFRDKKHTAVLLQEERLPLLSLLLLSPPDLHQPGLMLHLLARLPVQDWLDRRRQFRRHRLVSGYQRVPIAT